MGKVSDTSTDDLDRYSDALRDPANDPDKLLYDMVARCSDGFKEGSLNRKRVIARDALAAVVIYLD